MSAPLEPLKQRLLEAFHEGLSRLDPARLVEQALPPLPPKHARVRVIAAGKAAFSMAHGALARWKQRIEDVLIIAPDGTRSAFIEDAGAEHIEVMWAAHPLPDERSVKAAQKALARAHSLGRPDLLLALISGGASSLLALPPDGMSLEEKRRIVAALLESGADIRDVNTVRRHLSSIKGGRLARAAAPARVLSLLMSDVLGGEAHDVGSGPTVFDPSTLDDAANILRRAPLPSINVDRAVSFLTESLKPNARAANADSGHAPAEIPVRIKPMVLADTATLAHAVAEALRTNTKLAVSVQPDTERDAAAVALSRVRRASMLRPGEAIVVPCEPTLKLPQKRGRGGRAGHVALAAILQLPPNVVLLCGASDGVDGNSGHGGAMVCAADAQRIEPELIERALAGFDDATLHERMNTHIGAGPTGHNLADVHILARASSEERAAPP